MLPALLVAAVLALQVTPLDAEAPPFEEDFETRILAAESGEPIEGAQLWIVDERSTPISGEFWFSKSFTSRADGAVVGSHSPESKWWFVDADGFAPQVHFDFAPPEQFELRPGRDVLLTLLNVFDEPVRSTRVSWILGCGHTPDSRSGTTDENGQVLLRDIDPSVAAEWWISGAEVLAEYSNPQWNEDLTHGVLRCFPAPTRTGTLESADNEPLAGYYVGQPNRHRGPWSRTDERGRFRLFGANDSELQVRAPDGADLGFFPTAIPGFRRVIRLDPTHERSSHYELSVTRSDGGPIGSVPVTVIRVSDGWSENLRTDEEGKLSISTSETVHLLRVGGGRSLYDPRDVPTLPSPGNVYSLGVQLTTRRTARVQVARTEPGRRVWISTRSSDCEITDELDAVPLPNEECILRCLTDEGWSFHRVTDSDREPGSVIRLDR